MSLSLVFILVFVTTFVPARPAHAILPALAAGAATALEGTVVEAVGAAGLRWGAKQISQKIAPRVVGYLAKKGVDLNFLSKKPKRIARDLAEIELDGEDQAKLMDATVLLKREFTEIEAQRLKKWDKPEYKYSGDAPDPYSYTDLSLVGIPAPTDLESLNLNGQPFREGLAYLRHFYDISFTPVPYGRKTTVSITSIVNDVSVDLFTVDTFKYPTGYIHVEYSSYNAAFRFSPTGTYHGSAYVKYLTNGQTAVAFEAYKKYLAHAGTKVIAAQGLYFPRNIDDVYVRPGGSDAQYPSIPKIEPKKITIKVPDGEIGSDVEWDTKIDIDNHYNKYIFNYNTDIDITYDIDYTDIENPVKNEDFEKETEVTVPGGTGGEIEIDDIDIEVTSAKTLMTKLQDDIEDKFPVLTQLNAIFAAVPRDDLDRFEGIYVGPFSALGLPRFSLIDPEPVNQYAPFVKGFMEGFIWLSMIVFTYRRFSRFWSS